MGWFQPTSSLTAWVECLGITNDRNVMRYMDDPYVHSIYVWVYIVVTPFITKGVDSTHPLYNKREYFEYPLGQ